MTSKKPKKKKKKFSLKSNLLLKKTLALVTGMFLRFVRFSWRVTGQDVHPETQTLLDSGVPVIYALWHGRMYCLLKSVPEERVAILVSHSNDGDFITQTVEWLGFRHFIRGSEKRGGKQAALGLYRTLKEQGLSVAFTVDGPRGPRYKVKPGIIRIAAQTGTPIIPLGSSASCLLTKFERSWDHFHAPFFFSPMHLVYGQPLIVPADLNDDDVEAYCQSLEAALMQVNLQADATQGFMNQERL